MTRALLRSPYFVMALAALMYVVKLSAKVKIGLAVNSPMVYGEGLHNGADLAIVILGVMVMLISTVRIPRYTHGLTKLRNFGQLVTGSLLLLTAYHVGKQGLAGSLSYWPAADTFVRGFLSLPVHEALGVKSGHFPVLVAVLGASILLSWLVGRYQVRVGRANRNATVVADGQETISDGRVEAAILLGILGENLLHWRWLEYPASLMVAALLTKTAVEIIVEGFEELMQKKLDREIEAALTSAVLAVPGIMSIADMTTYAVGHMANVEMKIRTRAPASAHDELRFAVKAVIRPILARHDYTASRKVLSFHKPKRAPSCMVVAVTKWEGTIIVASTLALCSHFRRVNVEGGANERVEDYPVPTDLAAWLAAKHINVVRAGACTQTELKAIEAAGAKFEPTCTFTVASLDI